jgi:enoyl-CoA hydratase/carnithine racemase
MAAMDIEVTDELEGHVRAIVWNRPTKKNALTRAMYAEMTRALTDAQASARVRAVRLAGTSGVFTSGNDLRDFMAQPELGEESEVMQFLRALAAFSKPIVAAVEGPAIGVGVTMLLHCDLVLAAPSAVFQLPFVNLGLCPEGASTLLLPRLLGLQVASELLLWGEAFDAAAAHRIGLVNELVPGAHLGARVTARLSRIVELPPGAVMASKALLREPLRAAVDHAMKREAEVFRERLRTAEAAEALAAFFERRKPGSS